MPIPFKKLFYLIETNTIGDVFGGSSTEWAPNGTTIEYAFNDNRIPYIIGTKKRKSKKKQKRKNKIKIFKRNG